MFRLPFTATRWQVVTYLFGVALFSISFLVFLTSSVSWVITDLIGRRSKVGDAVGTLGFADELVALVACPAWGIISDRVGVRTVAVTGYIIIGLALFIFVQAKNVYPQLLLARLFFSLGGAATSTMVTAILPTMTYKDPRPQCNLRRTNGPFGNNHIVAPSISSELTITPARYSNTQPPHSHPRATANPRAPSSANSQLAGLVGMFTGLGALIALGGFLPLPARFQENGSTPAQAVARSYYVVGVVAFLVAFVCLIGLRNLPGEKGKGLRATFDWSSEEPEGNGSNDAESSHSNKRIPYHRLFFSALTLGFKDVDIGLGYLGGFVARASSVAISTFIPLAANAYFISTGACGSEDNGLEESDLGDIKRSCRRAYILAAILTGTSQLVALICAPLFGFFSGRFPRYNIPLLTAAAAGIIGHSSFAALPSPDPRSDKGSDVVYFLVAIMGFSQIGAIVCSLGLLTRGIQRDIPREDSAFPTDSVGTGSAVDSPEHARDRVQRTEPEVPRAEANSSTGRSSTDGTVDESVPLLSGQQSMTSAAIIPRSLLRGSVSGIYSFAGGFGILLLTKLGGALFDETGRGAPFVMMATFNGILFVVGAACGIVDVIRTRRSATNANKENHGNLNGELPNGSREQAQDSA
ncbi:MAG: hypothetical protein M1820_008866 [Bogoriella megaspora]|nr:MAG: hypothetical protein M1820_008866 [Bogoriella megaspora]